MFVIPAINEIEFLEVLKKIKIAKTFSSWVHLDIVDGKFAKNKTWSNPLELSAVSHQLSANIEAHLMVETPEAVIKDWVAAGAKRIIFHLEAMNGNEAPIPENNVEIGISINPETPVEDIVPYLKDFKFVQILAVKPGLAGQKFDEKVLEKIKFLKKYDPNVIIEVDGGLNLETAKLVRGAGADIIVSASYIWGSPNPQKAYEEFLKI